MTSTTTYTTRDAVLDGRNVRDFSIEGYGVNPTRLEVVSVEKGREESTGYAISRMSGMLYRWTQVGHSVKSNMVRVRCVPAVDTGDAAGTLAFEAPTYKSLCGRVNVALAVQP